ncbi:MAG: hypothetical protein OEY86_02495 [Nitrospira sp.]|nr:hypothetical protein [Nitrospira sp.]
MHSVMPTAHHPISAERHIEIVGKVNAFLGGLGTFVSLIPICVGLNSVLQHKHDMGGLALYVGVLWFAQAFPSYIGGKAFLKGTNWGRRVLIFACIFDAIVVPIGTVWAFYCWWVLFRKPTLEFVGLISDDLNDQPAQNHAHVRWRSMHLLAYWAAGWFLLLPFARASHTIPFSVYFLAFIAGSVTVYWRFASSLITISSTKWRRFATVFLIVFGLIPFWDALPGLGYYTYLCETQGGLRVNRMARTTELGRPFQYSITDAINSQPWGEPYPLDGPYEYKKEMRMLPLTVVQVQRSIVHRDTNEQLSVQTELGWIGGWLWDKAGVHDLVLRCPAESLDLTEIFRRTLEPAIGASNHSGQPLVKAELVN